MKWNELTNEKCPKCSRSLEYHQNGKEYYCPFGDFSVYTRNFERLTGGIKNNRETGKLMKYLDIPTDYHKETNDYYEAKNGEPMSDYQKITG